MKKNYIQPEITVEAMVQPLLGSFGSGSTTVMHAKEGQFDNSWQQEDEDAEE